MKEGARCRVQKISIALFLYGDNGHKFVLGMIIWNSCIADLAYITREDYMIMLWELQDAEHNYSDPFCCWYLLGLTLEMLILSHYSRRTSN